MMCLEIFGRQGGARAQYGPYRAPPLLSGSLSLSNFTQRYNDETVIILLKHCHNNSHKKISKFFQSSIPSPPYVLCVKLTWTLLSLQNLVLSSITKNGRLKASRHLIRVLVINDNGLWINDFIWECESILVHCIKSLSFVALGKLQASVIDLLLLGVAAP